MRTIFTILICLSFFIQASAQPPASDTLWTRIWGEVNYHDYRCHAILQTSDDGFLLAGETDAHSIGVSDALLFKTDLQGNLVWMHTYGGSANDVFEAAVLMPDGGFALGGKTSSWGAGGPDMWLVRTDSLGNLVWQHTYGGTDWDWCHCMIRTSDGGFALGGFTNNYGAGYYENMWLVKTDSLGIMQWQRSYEGPLPDQCLSLKQTQDSGYILGGYYGIQLPNNCDGCIIKTDAQGIVQWQHTYGGSGNDQIRSICLTPDGGVRIRRYNDILGLRAIRCHVVGKN